MHEFVILTAKYAIVIPALAWLYMLWRLNGKRLEFVLFSAVSAVLTLILVKLATTLHQDPRPFVRDHVTPYFASSTDNGFPSDHTAFSSVIAFVIARYRRKLGAVLLVVAIAIGTARVIAGVHHGQDIAGGVLLAALAVGTTLLLFRWVRHYKQS